MSEVRILILALFHPKKNTEKCEGEALMDIVVYTRDIALISWNVQY
jgi:hypothetical protein